MASKKPTPKKAPAKVAPKKSTPVAAKKAVAKPAPKKAVAKPVAKKPIAKPVAKKAAPKPLAKKVAAKPLAKAVAKPVAKKPIAKAVAKKVAPTPKAKVPVAKPIAKKPIAKTVEVKTKKVLEPKASKVVAKKEAPAAKPIVVKPAKSAKKSPVRTVISSTIPALPKKSDIYKTNTFGNSTLKNEHNKVIAHRKTSELKRRSNDENTIKKFEPEFTRSILDMNTNNEGPSYRYSDDDLMEFREIIIKKLDTAKTELQYLQGVIMRKDEGGTEDTENKYQNVEDGGASMEREQFNQLASRQITFIGHLEQALVRIENKTYGICRETGKLIDKARLRAVPHATLSIEAKNAKKN